MKGDLSNEIGAEATKLTPTLVVAAASVTDWGVQEWMYAVTICYIAMQAVYLVWMWNRDRLQHKAFAEKMASPLE